MLLEKVKKPKQNTKKRVNITEDRDKQNKQKIANAKSNSKIASAKSNSKKIYSSKKKRKVRIDNSSEKTSCYICSKKILGIACQEVGVMPRVQPMVL